MGEKRKPPAARVEIPNADLTVALERQAPRIHTITIIALLLVTAGIAAAEAARGATVIGAQDESAAHKASPRLRTFAGARFVYHTFTDSRMDGCYGNAPYLMAEFLVAKGHHGASFEIGYLFREGEPETLPTDWNVLSTSLSMWAMPITLNYLYHINRCEHSSTFDPYIGLGLGAFIGGEKIGVLANTLLKQWDGWAWGLRGSFIGNAVIGAQIAPWSAFDAVFELRWIQSGRGGNIDLIDEEDEQKFDAYLYPLVQRSVFDFTGWTVSVGVRW